ncbi:adenosine receptor A2a-like [Montipora capricornis]|uniref:adenosine receptor A2a-like n=1 Tax=Montipora capricornis TaxID=246305 RepID=UPI0035F1EA46
MVGMDLSKIAWILSFGVVAALAISGNALTIVIFVKKLKRRRSQVPLISLAVADLMVGAITVPLFIVTKWITNFQYQNLFLIAILEWTDMFTGFTSIFTLTVIALERLLAIGWPLRHRALSCKSYVVAIATPWILAFTVAWIATIFGYVSDQLIPFLVLISVFLFAPSILTCAAYSLLWIKEMSRCRKTRAFRDARDFKLAKTVALITGVFLVTWLPFQIFLLIINLCISCRELSPVLGTIFKLLQYGNSVVNILIYSFRIAEYRSALFEILRCCKCSCQQHQIQFGLSSSVSLISMTTLADIQAINSNDYPQTTRL